MLTQVYKFGPSRQKIIKGLVIIGNTEKFENKFVAGPIFEQTGIAVKYDHKRPFEIGFDTGFTWLHTFKSRDKVFSNLSKAIHLVKGEAIKHGTELLPNAVRTNKDFPWSKAVCADLHYIEANGDVEKEVFCNLIRSIVPLIIAYTGRAPVDCNLVQRSGSLRLLNSTNNYAPRYFASLSPRYLERVKQCLLRDDGVSRIDLLDINPLGDIFSKSVNSIELRFVDGQTALSSVRTDALLFQALMISARRIVQQGKRVGNVPQRIIAQNRAKALTQSMNAKLEIEAPAGNNREGALKKDSRRLILKRADTWLLQLANSLKREFQSLETEYNEISNLILGASLHQMGLNGIRNENDLYHTMLKANKSNWLEKNRECHFSDNSYVYNDILFINEERYPTASQLVRTWWTLLLRPNLKPTSPANTAKPQQLNQEAGEVDVKQQQVKNAISIFLKTMRQQPATKETAVFLNLLYRGMDSYNLEQALNYLHERDSLFIKDFLMRDASTMFRMPPSKQGWDSPNARLAQECALTKGISIVYIIDEEIMKKYMYDFAHELISKKPPRLNVVIMEGFSFSPKTGNKRLFQVNILLSKLI